MEYEYEWTVSGRKIGYNSTVLWVKAPGLYRCQVTHNMLHTECLSSLISVTGFLPQGFSAKKVNETGVRLIAFLQSTQDQTWWR